MRGTRSREDRTCLQKGSLWLLYGLITLGYALSFAVGATQNGRMHSWDTFFAIGSGLVVIGLAVRVQSILTLRHYFTYSVAKIEGHTLIETGLYRRIRHPGYSEQLGERYADYQKRTKRIIPLLY